MPNFKSISFKMAVLKGAGRICPPHVCVIQKTPCGIGLRLLTHVGFFRQNGQKFFSIWKKARISKKICHNRAKKFIFLRGFDSKNTIFEIPRNLIRKGCFQMTLNARKSCADRFLKIKTDDNRARFSRNQQNGEKFDSKTSKL